MKDHAHQSRRGAPPLNPDRFDAMTTATEKLWGLAAIARFLGVSVDKARRLARLDHCPIYKPDGESYFAFKSELGSWLRSRR